MSESTRLDIGSSGVPSLSRKRVVFTVGAAVCCMAALALVVLGSAENSAALFSPASNNILLTKNVEQDLASKGLALDKQAVQLRMLQQIARSIKVQESKLEYDVKDKKKSTALQSQSQAPRPEPETGAHVLVVSRPPGVVKGKNARLAFKTDETATRANLIVAEAQKRWIDLHKKDQEVTMLPSALPAPKASAAAAAASSAKTSREKSNQDNLNALATKADDEAASAIDAADEQRVVVAREASTYMKAEKRALVVQERAAQAEAKADTARALVEDAVAKNAENRAKVFRRRAARASAKAAKYAGQIKTLNDDEFV
jgi:hypothetical protein